MANEVHSYVDSFEEMMGDLERADPPARLAVSNVQINIRIPTAYHRVLKIRARKAGTSMTEIVVGLIDDYIHGRTPVQ